MRHGRRRKRRDNFRKGTRGCVTPSKEAFVNILLVVILVLCGSFVPGPHRGGHGGPSGAAAALAALDADAYRARVVPVAHPAGASKVVLERDVAASAAVGVRDLDPDRDGWAVAGRSPRLQVVRVVSVDVIDGSPEVTVVTEPDRCRVLSPPRLAPVRWVPPLPLRVTDADPARCAPDPVDDVEIADLVVTADPDVPRSASAAIGQGGGTVRATAADGSTYTLVVPAFAVEETAEISVAPAAVGGLDPVADGVVAGVSLQPAGLEFAVPATLEVRLPDGSTLPEGPVFASTHRDGEPGLELPTFRRGDDNRSLTMRIDHFSSAAVWTGKVSQLEKLFAAALQDVPEVGEQLPTLPPAAAAFLGGAPGSDAVFAQQVALYYTSIVVPALAVASSSPEDLARAVTITNRLRSLTSAVGPGNDPPLPAPIGEATTVSDLPLLLEGQVGGAAAILQSTYLLPGCSADVVVARDWITIPAFLSGQAQLFDDGAAVQNVTAATSCIRTTTTAELTPSTLTVEDRFVDIDARVLVSVPAQTPVPAGVEAVPLPGGRIGLPQAGFVNLTATGAAFVVPGGTDPVLAQALTGADGRVRAQLDRGEEPQERALVLRVVGVGIPGTAFAALGTIDEDLLFGEVDTLVGSDEEGLTVKRFDPSLTTAPITEQVLQPGGTTPVCVEVRDRLDTLRPGVPVTFRLIEGPGKMTETVVDTVFDAPGVTQGTACLDYEHPDGPVPPGTVAVVGAEAQLEDEFARTEIVLSPYAVDVTISARAEGEPGFVEVTDGSLPSDPGVPVDVQVVLEATQGEEVGDPLTPLEGGSVFATVEDGDGFLTVGGVPVVPLALTTDAFGAATFTWNPVTDEGGLVRVSHPATGPGVFATARFGPDPQVIEGDAVVRTNQEAEALEGVVEVTGRLLIGGTFAAPGSVSDLTPLAGLQRVGGLVSVQSTTALTTLDGLENVTAAGGLNITDNRVLTDLDGLDGLTTVNGGTLVIRENPALADLSALGSVTGSADAIRISLNPALTDLEGLGGITSVAGDLQVSGVGLQSLTGLESIASLGGNLLISTSAVDFANLTDYALPGLTTVFRVQISDFAAPGTPAGSLRTVSLPALTTVDRLQVFGADGAVLRVDAPLATADQFTLSDSVAADVTLNVGRGDIVVNANQGGSAAVVSTENLSDRAIRVESNRGTRVELSVPDAFQVRVTSNTGIDLDLLGIQQATQVTVTLNVGFTDDQARAWAVGRGDTTPTVGGNRPA